MYRSAWAEIDGFLVIRFQIGGGEKIGYMQPVGEGGFRRIIPALREDAHAHGQRLRIIGLYGRGARDGSQHARQAVRVRIRPRDGRLRLQRRRPAQPHGTQIPAQTQPHQPFHGGSTPVSGTSNSRASGSGSACSSNANGAGPTKGTPRSWCAEQRAMQRAFEHFEELEMLGGCIYVGDRLIAFTYGSAVNDHACSTRMSRRRTPITTAPSRSSTNSSHSTFPRVSR